MGFSFYRPSSQKKMKKFFLRNGFRIEQGGSHTHAFHPETDELFVFPRHNNVSNGLTQKICKRLIELGYDESEVKEIHC